MVRTCSEYLLQTAPVNGEDAQSLSMASSVSSAVRISCGRRMCRSYHMINPAPVRFTGSVRLGGHHRHYRRSLVTICEICGSVLAVSGWSQSTFVVDGRSPGGVYQPGDAMRRPYTDLSNLPGLDASHRYPFRSSAGRPPSTVIGGNLRFDVRGVGVVAVDVRGRRAFTWRSLPTGRRVRRPYTDRPLSARSGLPGRFMGVVPVRPWA